MYYTVLVKVLYALNHLSEQIFGLHLGVNALGLLGDLVEDFDTFDVLHDDMHLTFELIFK